MQGSYGAAIAHIQSGTKILREAQYGQLDPRRWEVTHNPYVPIKTIEDLFLRLGLQVSQVRPSFKLMLH